MGIMMRSKRIDLQVVSETLQEKCPFITFALLGGTDKHGFLCDGEKIELSVFVIPGTVTWDAIENILRAMTPAVPGIFCEVTLLNHVDPGTRHHAMQDTCLFIQKGMEKVFYDFSQRSSLDYRIMRAQQRRNGLNGQD